MTSVAAAEAGAAPVNRVMIVFALMLGTTMTLLDTTIANVALPHMAGSVSASGDQIAWALTSYIVATAIATLMSGWLTNKFGRKRVLLISVTGFVIASALCGAAQSLVQIVAFRVLQGILAAPILPLGQALLLDLYTLSERAGIMAVWGIGVAAAPIIGPVLGGWLTDTLNWRWVFYINLPLGALCLLGIVTFVPESERRPTRFDLKGFAMLSVAITAGQIMLDRGQGQGWFDSSEIIAEAVIAGLALWFFVVHSATTPHPFLPAQLLTDRNFVTSSVLTILTGVAVLSVAALLPTMLQTLYGYSVLLTGMLIAPRAVGAVMGLTLVSRLVARVDLRILMTIGLGMFTFTFFQMSQFTLDTSPQTMIVNAVLQGFGTPFIFLPTTTMAFATLPAEYRSDATALSALVRYLAGSGGISIMLAMVANFATTARGDLVASYSVDNPTMGSLPAPLSLADPGGVAMLSHEVDRQASMVGYSHVFLSMALMAVMMAPLLLVMKPPSVGIRAAPAASK